MGEEEGKGMDEREEGTMGVEEEVGEERGKAGERGTRKESEGR